MQSALHVHDDHRHGDIRDISRGAMRQNRRLAPWIGSLFARSPGSSADELPSCVDSLSKVGGVAGTGGVGSASKTVLARKPQAHCARVSGGFSKILKTKRGDCPQGGPKSFRWTAPPNHRYQGKGRARGFSRGGGLPVATGPFSTDLPAGPSDPPRTTTVFSHPPPARCRLPQWMTTVTAPTRTRWFRGRGLAAVAPRNAKGPVGYTGPVRGTSWRGVHLAGPATVSRGLTSRFRLAGPCRFRQDRHQNYRSFPGRNQGT